MKFFKRIMNRSGKPRLFVLSLEGVPLSLARSGDGGGRVLLPYLAGLLSQGSAAPIATFQPNDSHQAWATYMTGVNPGVHGVMGYLDRNANPFELIVADARRLKSVTLWELISLAGRKVGVINVPCTFPPTAVNGFMVGGLLSPNLGEGAYPFDLGPRLQEWGYRIDCDTGLAAGDPAAFLADAMETLSARFNAAIQLMEHEEWDFLQLHVSSTDRVNHFFWDGVTGTDQNMGTETAHFYRVLDQKIAELVDALPSHCHLAIMSEHGFAPTIAQVFLNQWLASNGYLLFGRGGKSLVNMHRESKAYCLQLGRIYINMEGREEMGVVPSGAPYKELKEELAHRIGALRCPHSGQEIAARVWHREELYTGPRLNRAADLIVEPNPGFDLRANVDAPDLSYPAPGRGVHVGQGAFFYVKGHEFAEADNPTILDASPTLLNLLDIPIPQSLEGRNLL